MFACDCPMNLCCFVYMYEQLLYCSHVWMTSGKISCKLTGSPSLNKVFWIELNWSVTNRLWNLWRRCLYGVYVRMPSIWMFWLCFDNVLEEDSCNTCFIDECRGHLYHQVGSRLHYQFYLDTAKRKSKQKHNVTPRAFFY